MEGKVSLSQRLLWICNTLFHQIHAIVTVFIFWTIFYHNNINKQFSWHMILSTLAYVPIMGEAIILFSSDNIWSQKIQRTTKYWLHGALLMISGLLVTVGISLIIDQKGLSAAHFKSIHGWTGLVSWILILVSQFLGLLSAKSQIFSSFVRPVYIKCFHNFLGLLGYVFGIVSLCYGLESHSFKAVTSSEARKAIYCLLGVSTFWSILAALKSGFNQLKSIFF